MLIEIKRLNLHLPVVTLLLLLIFASLPAPALSCGGCAANYPFMHEFPNDQELAAATAKFVEEYSAKRMQKYDDITITETWFVKLERPGIEEQYNTIEVILGFQDEAIVADETITGYHYTMIAYAEDEGFYFWPYAVASFSTREQLDNYLQEFVIETIKNQQVVETSLAATQDQHSSGTARIILLALLVVLGAILLILTVKAKLAKQI